MEVGIAARKLKHEKMSLLIIILVVSTTMKLPLIDFCLKLDLGHSQRLKISLVATITLFLILKLIISKKMFNSYGLYLIW